MKYTIIATAITLIALTGCSTVPSDYALYAETQQQIAQSRADADIARYKALSDIANSGDTTARVAAVIALQQGAPASNNGPRINAPTSAGDTALRWASVLVPSLTQFYAIGKNADVAIVNSNNSLEGQKSNNGMVVDLVQGRATPIIGNRTDSDGASEDFLLYPR
jgi:hypothetical protein